MNTDVNTLVQEIPKDLLEQSQVVLALANMEEIDRDVLAVLPPTEIAMLVLMERDADQEQELADWIRRQQQLWDDVVEVAEKFPRIYEHDGLPGWRGQPWAMAFETKWGAGLAEAVTRAEAWAAAQ